MLKLLLLINEKKYFVQLKSNANEVLSINQISLSKFSEQINGHFIIHAVSRYIIFQAFQMLTVLDFDDGEQKNKNINLSLLYFGF